MKINAVIREKRIAKGLTQEQVASYLGVSTPAVNKWEKAVSYPDITLLPALARLLDTDLNTLLSFQETLSRKETEDFLNQLGLIATTDGIAQAFAFAMDTLHKYPSCDSLMLNTALTLEGLLSIQGESDDTQSYLSYVENLYERAAQSKDAAVHYQAKAMLVSQKMQGQEWEKAEQLLAELPDEASFDKRQMQANLYIAQEKWNEAAQLMERKILSELSGVQSSLLTLLDIAQKEERFSDAAKIAEVGREMVTVFDLWDYSAYLADFQLALAQQDADTCLAVLEKMFAALLKPWKHDKSPLYCHIPPKEEKRNIGKLFLRRILEDMNTSKHTEYDFLRENDQYKKLVSKYREK